jgi:endonuclease YncB( thermonuclease family)
MHQLALIAALLANACSSCMRQLLLHSAVMTRRTTLIALAAASWLPASAFTREPTATVLSIGDGDTLRVQDRGRTITVRLACIDAPEMAQSPWGQQARQQLQSLTPAGSSLALRSKATDRYGRQVAEVSRGGPNINQALVASGAAFVYWHYIGGCDRQTYSRLESEARLRGLGVWGVTGGVQRPWDYRAGQRKPASRSSSPSVRRYTCKQIGSYAQAQLLMRQGHAYLDGDGDGEACESLKG